MMTSSDDLSHNRAKSKRVCSEADAITDDPGKGKRPNLFQQVERTSWRRSKQRWDRPLTGVILAAFLIASKAGGEVQEGKLPFTATIDLPGTGKSQKAGKGEPFGILVCLHAFETGIEGAKIAITLPPEVQNLGGETVWKGDLAPQNESCLNLGLRSRTEQERWSRPIEAKIEFTYQGMAVTRAIAWSVKGLEDTDFISK